ncbi:hypothetical protein FKW77_004192 [Venturia effusa]|uniref:C2H2-type domain-containing protein n=1 Tax=Venturia effusa TaxID=50376 RepID=A0A517LCB8_9PEZI|nr:hypothetical protein FKW77_004192 [Venturia effusa]
MSSVSPTHVYDQRFPPAEFTPPLSPYYASDDGYGNNMSSDQSSQYDAGSQPSSPAFYAPFMPPTTQNLCWSGQGQGFESPMTQNLTYDQGQADYLHFAPSTEQYQSLGYSHMFNYSSDDLHVYIDSLNIIGPQSLNVTGPYHEETPVAFQHASSRHSLNRRDSCSPAASGFHSSLSSSGQSVAGALDAETDLIRSRRRQKQNKGARIHKCRYPGCQWDFDRPFNKKEHEKTHRPRPRQEKCPLPTCGWSNKGFNRKHDLVRHVLAKHIAYAQENEHIYGSIPQVECHDCGKSLRRRDTLLRQDLIFAARDMGTGPGYQEDS